MTRKDYIIFADIIKKNGITNPSFLNEIVTYFKADNNNFDEERFLKACGGCEE